MTVHRTSQNLPEDCLPLVTNELPLEDQNTVARLSQTFLATHPMWQHLCRESGIASGPTDLCREKFLVQLDSGCPIAQFALGMLYHQGIWVRKDLGQVMDACETLFTWRPPVKVQAKEWLVGKSKYTQKVEELQRKAGRLWLEIFFFDNIPREEKKFKQQKAIRRQIIFSQSPYDKIGPCIQCDIRDGSVKASPKTSAASLKLVAKSSSLSPQERAIATIFWAKACGYSKDPDLDKALKKITNDNTVSEMLKRNAQFFVDFRLTQQLSSLSL